MKRGITAGLCVVILSACNAASLPPPNPPPLALGVGVEAATLFTPRLKPGAFFVSAGFDSGRCCGFGLYAARSYFGDWGDSKEGGHDRKQVEPQESRRVLPDEITELGGAFTVTLNEYVRIRMRGGLAASPPKDQEIGRSGVGGNASALVRLWGVAPPQIGAPASHLDLVLGFSAWALNRQATSAGLRDEAVNVNALLVGLRVSADYGVDFR
jgi:hypothetical protein